MSSWWTKETVINGFFSTKQVHRFSSGSCNTTCPKIWLWLRSVCSSQEVSGGSTNPSAWKLWFTRELHYRLVYCTNNHSQANLNTITHSVTLYLWSGCFMWNDTFHHTSTRHLVHYDHVQSSKPSPHQSVPEYLFQNYLQVPPNSLREVEFEKMFKPGGARPHILLVLPPKKNPRRFDRSVPEWIGTAWELLRQSVNRDLHSYEYIQFSYMDLSLPEIFYMKLAYMYMYWLRDKLP